MSTRQWNTVAERDNLVSLVDLCMHLLDEDDDVEFDKIDLDPGNELNDMDVVSLDSIEMDNDPIDIPDLVYDTDDAFDELDVMFAATTAYGQYILQDLESNIDFTTPLFVLPIYPTLSVLTIFAFARMLLLNYLTYCASHWKAFWSLSKDQRTWSLCAIGTPYRWRQDS
jgi:hypothetical protein